MKSIARRLTECSFEFEETCWEDMRDEVYKLNPELAKICDEISPGKEHTLLDLLRK